MGRGRGVGVTLIGVAVGVTVGVGDGGIDGVGDTVGVGVGLGAPQGLTGQLKIAIEAIIASPPS